MTVTVTEYCGSGLPGQARSQLTVLGVPVPRPPWPICRGLRASPADGPQRLNLSELEPLLHLKFGKPESRYHQGVHVH